ncbi:carboxypeptidase-like regulatory domain-containing protein [Ancylomarina sp. DW003]|nr:carboxypeptidase-like regulatory domain-containing protein [Ancylomarina sp. DW003]MDE5421034.1 carboxypeptidase-like regulatory domain-containing protein [Ancylomarina sp. DW003]
MKYKALQVLIFSLLSVQLCAQNYQIKGEIISDKNEVVPFANVTLKLQDSTFVTGVCTDTKGNFRISKVKSNNYILLVSCIGFETFKTEFEGISANINLGKIVLKDQQIALDDVTVTATNIIDKPNSKIVFPNPKQKESSTNGLNLLQSVMLPGVKVNPLMNSISLIDDGEIQLRINGVQVSEKEVIALLPDDIQHIEYIDNPGLRYGNSRAVINYKTKRYQTGGGISVDLMQSPHVMFSEDQISARLNVNKSEFKFNYSLSLRDFYEFWRKNDEKFLFENGDLLERIEDGKPGRYTNQIHNLSFTYNYQEPDKYFFNLNLKYVGNLEPHSDYSSQLLRSDNSSYKVNIKDYKDTRSYFPSVDLYYLRHLNNKERLMFNMVGSYIGTDLTGVYSEETHESSNIIERNVEGEKYSLIGEGLYERDFDKGRLTMGIKHTQSTTENTYSGSNSFTTDLDRSDTYFYTEFSGNKNKLNYSFGLGVNRSWLKQNNAEGYETYNIRPRFNVNYKFTDHFFGRVTGKMDNYSPDLSKLSDVEQAIDLLQIERGNPNLDPYQQYQADLYLEYHKGLFTGIAKSQYILANDPIMETTLREQNKFIRTYDNQKQWTKYNHELTVRVGMLWKVLQLSGTGGLNRYISEGKSYLYTYNNFYYRAEMMLAYKSWLLLFNANNSYNHFWGESVIGGENMHMMMVMKNHKRYSIGLGIINPFVDNYKRTNENRNQYASNKREAYLNESSKMVIMKFTWNFNFGRNYSRENKRLNNADNDAGIMNVTK